MTPAGAYLTTVIGTVTCLIWGAGAPAKTKKCGSPEGEYIFCGERSDLSRILQNKLTIEVHAGKRMGTFNKKQIKTFKKEDTTMGLGSVILVARNNRFGGYVYGRWKQKI